MEKEIRWAICGLGNISRRFLKEAQSVENTKVVACVSSSKERANEYKKKYGLEHAFTYDELVANASCVDAVYVCTNMNIHCKNTLMFLNVGIPVLCEKSVAVNFSEAEKMIECAVHNDTLFMEAMWTRFLPATMKVKKLIQSGALGKVLGIKGSFEVGLGHTPSSRVFSKELGGGSILDVGVYPVSYTHNLMGNPQSIKATGKVKNGVDRYCKAQLIYADGVRADLSSSVAFPSLKEKYEILCEKGKIIIPHFFKAKAFKIIFNDKSVKLEKFERSDFGYEIAHFNELIKTRQKQSSIMPHSATLDVMKILDEMNSQLGVKF